MTLEPEPAGEREQVLDWVVRHAARLGDAGSAPLRRITVSTATVAIGVEWSPPGPPGAAPPPTPERADDTAADPGPDTTLLVTAPMVGTFYRAQEPGAAPFVEIGDLVEAGQQVGIIEAMKLMNAVQADRRGRVSRIVAADGTPVQYDEPLLALLPHDGH
ncbi:acetyl-CoA carboxylase biotin carboxyl carrier protein [Sphaerisporangium corydalis]|uniref:Biotin carboxyl carrier protein of acetyl-CoA carboxylase n=1 Tax=Sphaerisporangium corydalis TaxID=1441875 RepID=A0ABV9EEC7_9ACTN|nr:biotin/lipoyl-containing protein [Sphaerisporangium corydalis]